MVYGVLDFGWAKSEKKKPERESEKDAGENKVNVGGSIFTQIWIVLVAQLVVEAFRVRGRQRPMFSFVICAVILVLMNLQGVAMIYTISFSDFPAENVYNAMHLIILVGLGWVGFAPSIWCLVKNHRANRQRLPSWAFHLQLYPSLGLVAVCLHHSFMYIRICQRFVNAVG